MKSNTGKKDWFVSWFDSKYYHTLYKHRTFDEAKAFVERITSFLEMPNGSSVLDLACGKGRHSIHLNTLGFNVTGVDLSEESIIHARSFENESLEFYTHDMRQSFRINYYDYIFNLFTSFGYFENERDDLNVFKGVKKGLKENGVFVFDFFNATKVIDNLVLSESKSIDNVDFSIKRRYENGFIYKDIYFNDEGKDFHFTERVRAFRKEEIFVLLDKAGLKPLNVFGNYKLDAFETKTSDRLLIVAKNA